jgi:hypothetical protein
MNGSGMGSRSDRAITCIASTDWMNCVQFATDPADTITIGGPTLSPEGTQGGCAMARPAA